MGVFKKIQMEQMEADARKCFACGVETSDTRDCEMCGDEIRVHSTPDCSDLVSGLCNGCLRMLFKDD